MRPIRLSMSAFGPFAKVEEIIFSDLGDNPLFLINGPTGAGKSTILDAICFALYGETTGNEREGREMRCDHSEPSTLTEIILEFELPGGKYRIKRIPDQLRPKARGEGYTDQKARAELHQIEGDEERLIVAPKVTEATEAIINLTGLSAEQFRQVMVLPQGKFRELLLAKSEEREMIFQQLFQTHVYSRLQNNLRDQANAILAALKEIQLQKKALLETNELHNSETMQEELANIEVRLAQLVIKKREVEVLLHNSQDQLQQAKLVENLFIDHERLKSRVASLQVNSGDIVLKKTVLERAEQAEKIRHHYQSVQVKKKSLSDDRKKHDECNKNLQYCKSHLVEQEAKNKCLPEKEKMLEKINSDVIELEGYRARSKLLEKARQRFKIAETELASSITVVKGKEKQLQEEKTAREMSEVKLQFNIKSLSQLSAKEVELDKLNMLGKSLRKISDLEANQVDCNSTLSGIKNREAEIEKCYKLKSREKEIYEQAWGRGQAAILAKKMHEGEPCLVCGSKNHPNVASSNERLPTEQELNSIAREVEDLRGKLEKIRRDRLRNEEESKSILKALTEEKLAGNNQLDLSLDSIRSHFKRCRADIEELKKIQLVNAAIEEKIIVHKHNVEALEKDLKQVRDSETQKKVFLASCQSDVKNQESELPEFYRVPDKLEKAIHLVISEQNSLKLEIEEVKISYQKARESQVALEIELKTIESNNNSNELEFDELVNVWDKSLKKSEFATERHFIESSMVTTEKETLSKLIRKHEDEILLATKELEQNTSVLGDKARPDLTSLTDSQKNIELNRSHIENEFHKIKQRQQLLNQVNIRLVKLQERQTKLEEQYGVVGKLSDISNGKNPHNLSLQRFVLSVLLDDVLTEASFRLNKMSKGRFQLYRKETVGDKRTKSGLDLVVEDAYTGKQRPAATLSGGESFMAALSLALGLSDVVQAYAGGIRLDMLFIDEGFGSLDPESLELAIGTLLDLRDSGRMVGIISHVEELKRMINIRLDVVTSREISTTRLVGV